MYAIRSYYETSLIVYHLTFEAFQTLWGWYLQGVQGRLYKGIEIHLLTKPIAPTFLNAFCILFRLQREHTLPLV